MHTINITGHHIDITPAIKDHVNEKLTKVSKLTDQITSVNVTLMKDSKEQKAEARVHLPGKEIFAAATSEERLFHAIDGMIDKLVRQVEKHKTKLNANTHKSVVAS
ncbi:ribosome hibernation-promoting factor, HPF/YfiA family [Marinomonas mediterranea]|jgi:SSU ribosomal protein S30P/sigma 54 modulation protein|uniref:Ribosome hibernation promoting factor n=1 Tax=Marinomonas mediterranea (strain ATCC 700492 / JCM 21426 / NBRC 103028 / MMB-1) TaxID=717774 RepID=F2JZ65_MARM1|nr:ribosome-associated translation inhibitor RaiA [Marinomonas mediterranea]ADZ92043.1 sigma 54 modulation protein/ribosomal protein S30EA [Marinomonas mediterranea MMB-1]WCN10009.1 ribosome-associated translation inhibitor RaiA [Marinomonas mediterranea]WCN14055.1 ribosome-associated translation inhibitor RaiA [Marinomonas mediterranea]WCN18115.1 ribosome-associated translation inhibitor RaiA [Marinomonas mediterranea MMB-1]